MQYECIICGERALHYIDTAPPPTCRFCMTPMTEYKRKPKPSGNPLEYLVSYDYLTEDEGDYENED